MYHHITSELKMKQGDCDKLARLYSIREKVERRDNMYKGNIVQIDEEEG